MQARPLRDRNLWLMVGATLIGLYIAWNVKAPCAGVAPEDVAYDQLCYTDLTWIYENRHQRADPVPYVDDRFRGQDDGTNLENHFGFLEYPVLTGLFIHMMSRLSADRDQFYVWNAFFLSAFALATTLLLYHSLEDRRRTALFALGPPLFLYAFHNWDLIAVFFTVLATYNHRRGDATMTGLALGLGACAKFFPLFAAPAFGFALLRRERRLGPRSLRFGLAFLAPILVLNLPFYLANRELFLHTYRFHLDRTPNFETIWYILGHFGREWQIPWLARASTEDVHGPMIPILLAGGLSVILFLTLRRGRPEAGAFAGIVLFLLVNKVYSVQYGLWLLPFLALLHVPWKKFAAYCAADLAVYYAVFTFFEHMHRDPTPYFERLVVPAVLARTAVLLWFFASYVRGGLTPDAAEGEPTPQKPAAAALAE